MFLVQEMRNFLAADRDSCSIPRVFYKGLMKAAKKLTLGGDNKARLKKGVFFRKKGNAQGGL